jgi:hypothetical protein
MALKLATKGSSNQEEQHKNLTPESLAIALKLAAKVSSNQEEQHDHLTPESLAMALKLATKAPSNDNNDDKDTDTDSMSADQMLAAMRAAIRMTHQDDSDELATPEILSDALKLAKK